MCICDVNPVNTGTKDISGNWPDEQKEIGGGAVVLCILPEEQVGGWLPGRFVSGLVSSAAKHLTALAYAKFTFELNIWHHLPTQTTRSTFKLQPHRPWHLRVSVSVSAPHQLPATGM